MSGRVYRIGSRTPTSDVPPAFLDEVNDEQRAAVCAGDGPTLVIAGAGSGKTRTLVYRVAFLLHRGLPPERILLLTFTNKAAREMLARAEALLGPVARRVTGGTFHHVGNVILRRHGEQLGYGSDYSIIDPSDARDLMGGCVGELGASTHRRRFPRADHILYAYSYAVNTGRPLADVFAERYPHFVGHLDAVGRACDRFAERKVELNVVDYDDLLLGWRLLLEGDEQTAAAIRNQFAHVLVDEYQDTNRLQGELIDAMAREHRNVMAVGDDCQAIYSFRGASFENIIGFPVRYEGCRTLNLNRNYRSTPEVLELANRSIARNRTQFDKKLDAVRGSGPLPAAVPCQDTRQQAAFVAHRVLELRDEGTALSDIAVLYRAHRHAAELEVELKRRNIPYIVRSGVRFFEQAHIKDVLAWLRVVHNPRDELAWLRVLRLQPGIGQGLSVRLVQALLGPGDPMRVVATGDVPSLPRRAKASWERVRAALGRLGSPDLRDDPAGALELVLERGYQAQLEERHGNARARLEDIRALASYGASFDGLQPFLDEVSGLTEVSGEGFKASPEGDDEHLVLSTVHQAKGLEWHAVFVIGLAEGLFPLPMALRTERELEEERRLFYVAVTRARTELHLVYPTFAPDRGYRDVVQTPSSFLLEVDAEPPVFETWRVMEDA